MIAALDATPLTLTSGGLRRYTQELLGALQAEFPEDRYLALSDQLPPRPSFLDRRWWTIGLPRALRRLNVQVFHGTDFAVPYLPVCPAVMSIHDVSPWMNPEWHAGAARVRRRTPILIRLGLATLIATGTEAVKRQIVNLFSVDTGRVVVIPDAPASHLHPVSGPPPPRPYFLFLGTIEPRKNVPALVMAWRELRRTHDVDLILAGNRRADGPRIDPEPGLTIAGEVPDADLPRLLSGAAALVYPSLYEGFGLPIVEAMQCGTPVITSRDPALMEVSGGAALHTEASGLLPAMRGLLDSDSLQARLRASGLQRAAQFSWRNTARLTHEAYFEAIRRTRRPQRRDT